MEEQENQPVASKRDKLRERLAAKHPDLNADDEELYAGQISDDYDDYDQQIADRDKRIGEYEQANKDFAEMMTADPRTANLLLDLKNGKNIVSALIERYGDDLREALGDPSRVDELAKAHEEYVKQIAKSKELDETYAANLQKSIEAIEQAVSSGEITDEEADRGIGALTAKVDNIIQGNYTVDDLRWALNAENHDADVQQASEEGEVRGRNTKIKEKLRKAEGGDQLPALNGGQGKAPKPQKVNPFEAAANQGSVWDGMQRETHAQ